ncbi:MFS general substrate transporter [Venustampulla echinocandica]|uniref:MFS general substrate transporter n=1 Tax=Venustampulla echinocandica TaxID=2656787 RepID=A0A370TIL7_9HELO|nr:MFS general substrate transporter [Venustampulla echinocandica]RDL35204.1 MFS general substrate transporter [Venustampulla echinocandica]
MGKSEVEQRVESDPVTPTEELADGTSERPNVEHQFNEQTNYLPTARIITIFLVCASIDFFTLMDQTTLAASLSIVSSQLGAGSQSSWIAGGFFITSTSFQLLYGRLSDIWSRKNILLVGFGIFFFGSLASSLATNVAQLIVFRAITGIGGGGLMTIAQTVISDVVSLRERGKYQGIFGAFVALANGIGPVIGGALAKHDWRWIFRLNLPLTAITMVGVIFFTPLKKVEGDWKKKIRAIDFLGAFFALGGSTLIVLALTWGGGEKLWDSAAVIASLVLGVTCCVAFVLWQWKGATLPLVPLYIFKQKVVNGASLTMFINGWGFVTQVYYIPTFYQLVYGYSTVKSGALLLPITLTQTAFSTLSGLLIHKTGRYREAILVGWIAWSVGLGMFSTLNETSGLGKQIGYAVLTGFGVGCTLQPSLIAIQASVSRKNMAVVTSFRSFIRNLGATFGLAVAGTIINNSLRSALSGLADVQPENIQWLLNHPGDVLSGSVVLPGTENSINLKGVFVEAYKKGFRTVFLVGAGLAASAFVFAFFLLPQIELSRPDEEKLKAEGKKYDEELRQKKEARSTQALTSAEPAAAENKAAQVENP